MDRLTYRCKDDLPVVDCDNCEVDPCDCNLYVCRSRLVARLAAYEDIGLTPQEIEQQLYNFGAFLSEQTGGRMSKTNYSLEAMVAEANDYQQRICDECPDRKE